MALNKKIGLVIKTTIAVMLAVAVIGCALINEMSNENFNEMSNENVNKINNEKISAVIAMGRLERIPKTATEIEVDNCSNRFSGNFYLKFKAPLKDIRTFLSGSESIKNQKAITLSEGCIDGLDSVGIMNLNDDDVPWFNPDLNNSKVYKIEQDKNANYGVVIVDEKRCVVYIKVSHS